MDDEAADVCAPRIRRGHGGVAVLWPKSLSPWVSVVTSPSTDRILGIQLHTVPVDIVIFAVYLPTRTGSSEVRLYGPA